MISRKFVRRYLEIKDMLECGMINKVRYKLLILDLCDEYRVDPAKLAEYNMDLEPKKINYGSP